MKLTSIPAFLALIVLATPVAAQSPASSLPITPTEAVRLAAAAAPDHGVQGTFVVMVKASGDDKKRKMIFLNSELDYRDQRNITVGIERSAIPELEARFGKNLKQYFIGKQISVTGIARRVTIYFGRKPHFVNGKVANKYYFQTHVPVASADQLVITPP